MQLPEICIRRPVFATVMSLMIVLLGAISFTRLTVREYPKIDTPVVSVRTVYKGASPQVIESQVTRADRGLDLRHRGRAHGQVRVARGSEPDHRRVPARAQRGRGRQRRARPRGARARGAARGGRRVGGVQDRGRRAGHHVARLQLRAPRHARALGLRRPLHRRPAEDAAGRRLGDHRRQPALRHAHLAGPRPPGGLQPHAAGRGERAAAPERGDPRRAHRVLAARVHGAGGGRLPLGRAVQRHDRHPGERLPGAPARRGRRAPRRPGRAQHHPRERQSRRWAWAWSSSPPPTRCPWRRP